MERNEGGALILVVDDDEAVLDSTADVLQAAGYTVTSSGDAEGALDQLATGDVRLLILDLGLGAHRGHRPSNEGLDLLDQVAKLPPVILVSGSGLPPKADPRVRAFFPKPVAPQRLLDEVEHLLSQ